MHFWDRHKTITCYYEILMASVCEKYDLRKLEYDILLFLYHNPKYHTAADIVRIRKSTKSHVSTALKVLEEKGFIEKETAAAGAAGRIQLRAAARGARIRVILVQLAVEYPSPHTGDSVRYGHRGGHICHRLAFHQRALCRSCGCIQHGGRDL